MNSKTATVGRLPEPPVRPPTYELRRPFHKVASIDWNEFGRSYHNCPAGQVQLSATFRYPDGSVRVRTLMVPVEALRDTERWAAMFSSHPEDEAARYVETQLRSHARDAAYDEWSVRFCEAEERVVRFLLGEDVDEIGEQSRA